MSAPPITRPSLLLRLRDRENHAAWSEFLELYEPVIYRLACRRQFQDADAREIVQEVLIRVAAAIDRFDPEGNGTFRGWLSRTTRRVTVDRFRRIKGRERATGGSADLWAEIGSAGPMELEKEFDLEHRRQLFRCAAEEIRPVIAEASWRAFWETAVRGRSAADVAKELETSEGAVYVARCRTLKRIRQYVESREAE